MVTTPWYDHEIPMTEAAEIGTRKVIAEHSTIGIVITTDGSISDIPREDYLEAEERVIRELQELGKPFIVLLNSADPKCRPGHRPLRQGYLLPATGSTACRSTAWSWGKRTWPDILKAVLLSSSPCRNWISACRPGWMPCPDEHPIKAGLYEAIRQGTAQLHHIREVDGVIAALGACEDISEAKITAIDLGHRYGHRPSCGLPRELFYRTLSEQSGFACDG